MPKQNTANNDYRQEERLTAVLVLDYFNPFINEVALHTGLPLCLWPVDGKPLLDYTIQTLMRSGIQEIILLATSQAYEIRSYVMNSQWFRMNPAAIRFISCSSARSLGDCLKDLEQENVLNNHFLLLYGNGILLTNEKLNQIFDVHKENIAKDKNCIMTVVHRELNSDDLQHPSFTDDQHLCIVRDANSHRIYDYSKDDIEIYEIPLELIEKPNVNIEIFYCPLDCHVAVCSLRVLDLFKDNFDCSTIHELIKGVIRDEVLANDTIYSFIYESGYFLSVHNVRLYMKGALDILRRWTFPIVPDILASFNRNLTSTVTTPSSPSVHLSDPNLIYYNTSYPIVYDKHNIYKQGDVQLERLSDIQQDVFIGHRSHISSGVSLRSTLIGQNCFIGKNSRIENSIIWNNVKIGENCFIQNSILCDNVVVRNDVQISKNCILCKGVLIDHRVRLGENLTLIASNPSNPLLDDVEIDEELQLTPDTFRRSNSKQRRSSTRLSEKSISDRSINSTTEEPIVTNKDLVGPEGLGRQLIFRSSNIDQSKTGDQTDDEDDADENDENSTNVFDVWGETIRSTNETTSTIDDDEISPPKKLFSTIEKDSKVLPKPNQIDDSGDETDESSEGEGEGEEEEEEETNDGNSRSKITEFEQETMQTLKRAFLKNIELGNITAEIQMLKPTFAVLSDQFDQSITRAVFLLPFQMEKFDEKTYFSTLKSILERTTGAVLKNYLKITNEQAQMTLINGLHEICLENLNVVASRIVQILNYLYENDIVEEEFILKWFDKLDIEQKNVNEDQKVYYDKLRQFVEWLQKAESEDDEDED